MNFSRKNEETRIEDGIIVVVGTKNEGDMQESAPARMK